MADRILANETPTANSSRDPQLREKLHAAFLPRPIYIYAPVNVALEQQEFHNAPVIQYSVCLPEREY